MKSETVDAKSKYFLDYKHEDIYDLSGYFQATHLLQRLKCSFQRNRISGNSETVIDQEIIQ